MSIIEHFSDFGGRPSILVEIWSILVAKTKHIVQIKKRSTPLTFTTLPLRALKGLYNVKLSFI